MKRREFIAGLGSAALWPLAVRAQRGDRVRRIGPGCSVELRHGGDGHGGTLITDPPPN